MNAEAGSGPGSKPGERLRAERERRGFSTQKVAEDLHVDAWVVEALEAGRHESLGAPVFVKGHLRKYAILLGLDADELVHAFGQQADPPLVMLTPKARTRPRRRVPVKAILLAVGLLAVIAAAFVGYRYWRERAPAASAPVQPAADVNAVAVLTDSAAGRPQPSPQGAGSPASARIAEAAATKRDAQAPAARPVRVRLSFSADSWVELYDGNHRRVFFDMGVANQARGFTVAAPARLFLGYADGVQVEIDGQPVTLEARLRRDNVAHFTIDARGRLAPAGTLSQR
jgi:cytoskeleton protein RodZ